MNADITIDDYFLPDGMIANFPAEPRDSSRMLYLPRDGSPIRHVRFSISPIS